MPDTMHTFCPALSAAASTNYCLCPYTPISSTDSHYLQIQTPIWPPCCTRIESSRLLMLRVSMHLLYLDVTKLLEHKLAAKSRIQPQRS